MTMQSSRLTPLRAQVGAYKRASAWRLVTSPSAAFILAVPTLGYYTLAAYVNVVAPDGSGGSILIRSVGVAVLLLAWLGLRRGEARSLGYLLLPAGVFFAFYAYRLAENMLYLDMVVPPGNAVVLLTFCVASVLPAYVLARSERGVRDEDMAILLSLLALLFVIGMAFNWDALTASSDRRMALEKVNPISLAYVASSIMLFYLIAFGRSKKARIEALLIVPILLVIMALARSRGMMISTGFTLVVYVIALRGTRRIRAVLLVAAAVLAIGFWADPTYVGSVVEALSRMDVHTDMSTASRAMSFQGAWDQFLENPLLGRYAVELGSNYYPHNIYLESLMSVGLVGTVPFAIHLALASRAAWGLLREREASLSRVFIALLFIRDAVGAGASGALWGVPGFWISSVLVIAMWYGRRQDFFLLHACRHKLSPAYGRRTA